MDKFTDPTKINDPAWESFEADKVMVSNKRGKNIVFKSKFTNEVSIGGVSIYELQRINIENNNLKRRLEMMTKRVSEIEDELYDKSIKPNPSAWVEDETLKSFEAILSDTNQTFILYNQNIDKKTELIGSLKEDIEKKENLILQKELEERSEKDEIYENEDMLKIIKLKLENGKVGSEKATDEYSMMQIKAKISRINQNLKKYAETKLEFQSDMIKMQTQLKEFSQEKAKLIKQKLDAENKIALFTTMVETRRSQLTHEFFDKNQKAVETDLKNFVSIHEAANDASVESLSKSLVNNCLSKYVKASNHLLANLKLEIKEIQKRRKPQEEQFKVFATLSHLWEILEENIQLKEKVNNYSQGMLAFLAEHMIPSERYEESELDYTASFIDEKELMKRILAKNNLDTLEDEVEESDKIEYTKEESKDEEEMEKENFGEENHKSNEEINNVERNSLPIQNADPPAREYSWRSCC